MVETKNTKRTGERTALESFFAPNSIAVIGATERPDSVGRTILANLSNGTFSGKVYPVNPLHSQVLGFPCFASIGAVGMIIAYLPID
ncbi:MAG TPA: CoA-binding protein [Candidatus Acidoferrales bacterium]|nr:CoA-binding protein [Candidatus Acidoferrales bacterium]